MVVYRQFFAALLCAAAVGCQQQRLRESFIVDAFSAEARVLEDKLYELNDRIDDLEARLDSRSSSGAMPEPRRSSAPPRTQSPPEIDEPDLTPPEIVPGSPTTGGLPPPAAAPAAGDTTPPDQGAQLFDVPADGLVAQVRLNQATRAANFDGVPGDDGMWVVVQPQNRAGLFVPKGAPLTVVLLDATTRSHVGRWEFDAEAVEQAIARQNQIEGIFLQVPWGTPPRSENLHVFVRYETEDGRKLEADQPLSARLDQHVAERWTPRSTPAASSIGTPRVATQPGRSAAPPQGPPADIYR